MDQRLVTLYAFTLSMCESLMQDITDEELRRQPAAGVNTPAWILGHLAICTDSALRLLGNEKRLPEPWHKAYGMGSDPAADDAPKPTKDELLSALRKGHQLVAEAVAEADSASLDGPNPLKVLASTLPTKSDLLAHLLSTHEAMHLGHLSNWRRQMGRPPLF
ncbi:MAG: DinB family protein [Planctomycetota bacterium]